MKRRELMACVGTVAAAVAASGRARGDDKDKKSGGILTVTDYLARAALLLDETKRSQDWIGYHPGDVGLATLAFELAEIRSGAAAKLAVPVLVKNAHMHLLLALENTTASFDASSRGDGKKAAQRMAAARAEEATLGLALEQAKLKMPIIK